MKELYTIQKYSNRDVLYRLSLEIVIQDFCKSLVERYRNCTSQVLHVNSFPSADELLAKTEQLHTLQTGIFHTG